MKVVLRVFFQCINLNLSLVYNVFCFSMYTLLYRLVGDGFGPNVMFSDGEHVGHVAAAKDVGFWLNYGIVVLS